MDDLRLGAIESRFADIIWDNAPLGSGELVLSLIHIWSASPAG